MAVLACIMSQIYPVSVMRNRVSHDLDLVPYIDAGQSENGLQPAHVSLFRDVAAARANPQFRHHGHRATSTC